MTVILDVPGPEKLKVKVFGFRGRSGGTRPGYQMSAMLEAQHEGLWGPGSVRRHTPEA